MQDVSDIFLIKRLENRLSGCSVHPCIYLFVCFVCICLVCVSSCCFYHALWRWDSNNTVHILTHTEAYWNVYLPISCIPDARLNKKGVVGALLLKVIQGMTIFEFSYHIKVCRICILIKTLLICLKNVKKKWVWGWQFSIVLSWVFVSL